MSIAQQIQAAVNQQLAEALHEFEWEGARYRANEDASMIERYDGDRLGWNATHSLRLRCVALTAIGK